VYEKYGFHIRGFSDRLFILVLPIQYSHCWNVDGSGSPTLFRANLMQVGLEFSGALDAKLVFRYGPILSGRCRVDDLNHMNRLHIDQAREPRKPVISDFKPRTIGVAAGFLLAE
jgi:hypothetical protein